MDKLSFSNKINFKVEINIDAEESDYQFLDRTTKNTDSFTANSREITLDFLDSSNGHKYDRLVREAKINVPFKRLLPGDSSSISRISCAMEIDQHDVNVNVDALMEAPYSSNGHKYDSLDREAKMNVPFERLLSGENSCTIPISLSPMEIEQHDVNVKVDALMEASPTNKCSRKDGATTNNNLLSNGRKLDQRLRRNQELETCAAVLARRQKQIDYGKNTIGYDNYIQMIPKSRRSKDHPWTPPKQFKYSRRAFDGLIKLWRMKLHRYDAPSNNLTNEN